MSAFWQCLGLEAWGGFGLCQRPPTALSGPANNVRYHFSRTRSLKNCKFCQMLLLIYCVNVFLLLFCCTLWNIHSCLILTSHLLVCSLFNHCHGRRSHWDWWAHASQVSPLFTWLRRLRRLVLVIHPNVPHYFLSPFANPPPLAIVITYHDFTFACCLEKCSS